MSFAYHRYIARCQHLLRLGAPVGDILFSTSCRKARRRCSARPPPRSGATRKCRRSAPTRLGGATRQRCAGARVRNGRIAFEGGAEYALLVLPETESMTLELVETVRSLVRNAATAMGPRPLASPSRAGGAPADAKVREIADELSGVARLTQPTWRRVGRGRLLAPPRSTPTPAAPPTVTRRLDAASQWTWSPETDPMRAPPGRRHFRFCLALEEASRPLPARLIATADNAFRALVNGRTVGKEATFLELVAMDVLARLRPRTNLVEIVATNGGDGSNLAGLNATLEFSYPDGRRRVVSTDSS
ncbi:MAG: glycosyl hydrolase [Kiritimatiellae bacterium]|nr:glycosyl hydrolase [Kiritimatiellia bacterium]